MVLAEGSLMHHLLDGMWRYPATFLWPLYGWGFPPGLPEEWFWQWLAGLLHDPSVYVPEVTGGVILVVIFGRLVCRVGLLPKMANIASGLLDVNKICPYKGSLQAGPEIGGLYVRIKGLWSYLAVVGMVYTLTAGDKGVIPTGIPARVGAVVMLKRLM